MHHGLEITFYLSHIRYLNKNNVFFCTGSELYKMLLCASDHFVFHKALIDREFVFISLSTLNL